MQNAEVLSTDKRKIKEKIKETMLQKGDMEIEKCCCDVSSEKMFITSPADVDTHRKVKLQNTEVLDHYKKEFEKYVGSMKTYLQKTLLT